MDARSLEVGAVIASGLLAWDRLACEELLAWDRLGSAGLPTRDKSAYEDSDFRDRRWSEGGAFDEL
jgi:hypothetical protein